MEYLVAIAAFIIFLILANYLKKKWLVLTEYKRVKFSLIFTSIFYTFCLTFLIIITIKYFNYLTLINYWAFFVLLISATYTTSIAIRKLKRLKH